MSYTSHYNSPLGVIMLACENDALTGVWFVGQKYFARSLPVSRQEEEQPVLVATKRWLDIYFSGHEPEFMPNILLRGSAFQMAVWNILQGIRYGTTMTYGQIAEQIARQRGLRRMSAQAVGGAVGHNPVGILVPCHRVVGSNGSLTGYAGGIEKKIFLLKTEQINMSAFFVPRKGTAL